MPNPTDLDTQCPLCNGALHDYSPLGKQVLVGCRNCGEHTFTTTLIYVLRSDKLTASQRAQIAYGVRRIDPETVLTTELIAEIEKTTPLPGASGRIDNLVLHLATSGEPGSLIPLKAKALRATLGCISTEAVLWAIGQAAQTGLLTHPAEHPTNSLSSQGWNRYEALLRAGSGSKHAFMAMSFGHPDIADFYRDHLQVAIAQTGFALRKTNDAHAAAGAIDARMKVEIRTARFVLCDLSHGNRGAYWEAGFAEGVGRPVIYLCRSDVLRDKAHPDHPHFDTANQLIVAWDVNNPSLAVEELKAVVRATLPAEAIMEDAAVGGGPSLSHVRND